MKKTFLKSFFFLTALAPAWLWGAERASLVFDFKTSATDSVAVNVSSPAGATATISTADVKKNGSAYGMANGSPFYYNASAANSLVANGGLTMNCQFKNGLENGSTDYYWSIDIPVTLPTDSTIVISSVVPQLYVCNLNAGEQVDTKRLSYQVALLSSDKKTTYATTGETKTNDLKGTLLNTVEASFDSFAKLSNSFVVRLTVKPSHCDGGAYTGIAGFVFNETLPEPCYLWDGEGGTVAGFLPSGEPVYTVSGKVKDMGDAVPAKNFTFSMWTKKTSSPNWRDICGFSDASHQFKLEENRDTGNLNAYSENGGNNGWNTEGVDLHIPSADYPTDLFLLTVVQENGVVKAYVNGVLKMTSQESTVWTSLTSDTAKMKWFAWGCSPTTSGGVDRDVSISAADVRIYDTALLASQVAFLYEDYSSRTPKDYTRTVTGTTADWSATNAWTSALETVDAPPADSPAILTLDQASEIVMNAPADLLSLTVNGSGKATFKGTEALKATMTTVATNVDVSNISATLGSVAIAENKTLTAQAVSTVTAPATATLVLNASANAVFSPALSTHLGTTKVTGGTLKYTSGNNRPAGPMVISGANAALQIAENTDVLGYGGGLPSITIEEGARFEVYQRDTFNRALILANGNLRFNQDAQNSGRSIDFFSDASLLSRGNSTIGGNDTTDLTSIVDSGKIAIRRNNFEITVEDGTLNVYSEITTADGGTGSLFKKGAGTLALYRAATSALPVEISAGKVQLVGAGSMTTGAYAVAQDATLSFAPSATVTTFAPTNTITGSGTVEVSNAILDVSSATLAPTLHYTITNGGTIALGATRLMGTLDGGCNGTLTLAATAEEVAAEMVAIAKYEDDELPGNLTITATVPEGTTAPAWTPMVRAGYLVLSTVTEQTHEWSSSATEATWNEGLEGFALGDHVIFGENNTLVTVDVPAGIVAGDMTVEGNYLFKGKPFSVGALTVAEGASLILEDYIPLSACTMMRLTAKNVNGGTGANATPAFAELILMKDGRAVAWPRGTTIVQKNTDGTETQPEWVAGGNEKVNALIDGVYGASNEAGTYTNPDDGSTGTYSSGKVYNKWWPTNDAKAAAVITLGTPVDFNGYCLVSSDHNPRSPKDWTLEVSTDGVNWMVLDEQMDHAVPGTNAFYVYKEGNTIFPINTSIQITADEVTIAGAIGNKGVLSANTIVFEEGSQIVLAEEGPLVVEGDVSVEDTIAVVFAKTTKAVSTTRIPVLKTSDEDVSINSFTMPSTHVMVYEAGVYYAVAMDANLYATLEGGDVNWSEIQWTNVNGTSVTNPDFDSGEAMIYLNATAKTNLFVTDAVDVKHLTILENSAEIVLVNDTLTTLLTTIEANASLGVVIETEGVSIPTIDGTGTLVKYGAASAIVDAVTTHSNQWLVAEGTLLLNNAVHTAAYQIEVLDGATLQVGATTGSVTSTAATLTLHGGATLKLSNGNATSGTTIAAKIAIVDAETKPAVIQGAVHGDGVELTGPISGAGTLEIQDLDYNAFKISGVISDSTEGALKVKVCTTTGVTFAGANTYTGGTTIVAGAKLTIAAIGNLGASGDVIIAEGGKLDVTVSVDTKHVDATGWTRVKGNGTIAFNTTNNKWQTLPDLADMFATTLTVENNLTNGLILPEPATDYTIGSLTGSGAFRVDYGGDDTNPRSLEIIQSKNTTYTGAMLTNDKPERLSKFILSGADGATEKTLTYEGNATVATPLTIDATGVLNLTGAWAGPVTVQGTIGGSGVIGGALTYEGGATIDMTSGNVLTANGAVTLPEDTIKVVLNEFAALDVLILKATNIASTTMPTATIVVDGNEVATIQVEKREDGLYLPMKQTYTRTFDGTSTTWVATDAWTIAGSTATADKPLTQSDVAVTVNADTVVTHNAKLHLSSLTMEGDGVLTLVMDISDWLTDENYLASPYTFDLVEIDGGMDLTHFKVQTTGAKYGAFVRVSTTESKISATVTLPESMLKNPSAGILSVNFATGRPEGHPVNERGPFYIADDFGYDAKSEVPVSSWAQYEGTNYENKDLILHKHGGGTEILTGALIRVTSAVPWSVNEVDMANTLDIFKGYLDDGTAPQIEIDVPDGWTNYTAYIYCMTDAADGVFAAKTVNGTNYSYADGVLTAGATNAWGNAGNSRNAPEEGTNVMIVPNLQGDFSLVSPKENGRGCIAGLQLVQTGEYDLALAPKVYTATLTTDVAWANIAWTKPAGATADAPTAKDLAEITLGASVTVDMTGATASQVTVMGRNQTLCLENLDGLTMPWSFDTNTTLRLDDATMLPQTIVAYPGRLLYNYMVEEDVTGIKDCVKEFAKGYTGTISRPEGSIIEFSGGEAVITIANQGETGRVICSGDVLVTRLAQADTNRDNTLAIGNFEVLFKDKAQAVVKTLILSEAAPGYEATLMMEGQSTIQVTGTSNVDAKTASIMVGHWNGPSTLILRDEARLVADGADMLVGLTSNNQTMILEGGELRVRGVMLSKSATGTNTLNLVGGQLTLGATGIGRYGTSTLTMAIDGGALGAFVDLTLGADFAAMSTVTIDKDLIFKGEAMVTLTDATLLNETISVKGGALTLEGEAFEGATYDLSVEAGTMVVSGGLDLDVQTMTLDQGATVAIKGGTVTVEDLDLRSTDCMLEIPLVSNLSNSGYLIFAPGSTMGDLSGLGLVVALDPNRATTDRLLPHVPVILGTADANTVAPRSPSIKHNTNNAVTEMKVVLETASLGQGYYLSLEGAEVMKSWTQNLTQTPFTFTQKNASLYPYAIFNGTDAQGDNTLALPEGGLKLYQVEFVGEAIKVVAADATPAPLLHVNGATIGTDITFDLTTWKDALMTAMRGAVKDVPVSFCLVAGGSNIAPGVTLSVNSGLADILAAAGVTEEIVATNNGLYYVLRAEARLANTISVNFTDSATPLVAPPVTMGAYPVAVTEWTSLTSAYSTPELFVTDGVGVKGVQAMRGDVATRLVSSTSVSRSDETNPIPLKVWTNDAGEVTLTVENVPFEAYRVALIFAADVADAAFACATVNGQRYAMDRAGYTRANVVDYVEMNASGSVNFFVAGDNAWGETKAVAQDDVDVLGVNTLVTDVFVTTDANATAVITLPALTYGQIYGGVAALQVIEAPAVDTSVATDYAYTFTAAGTYDLTVLVDDKDQTWANGAQHNLTLTSTAEGLVTVMLPYGFTAKTVTLEGKAFALATPAKVAIQVESLNAQAVESLTLSTAVAGEVLPPTKTLVVEAPVTNNGQPFTIPASLTLVLTEDSKMSTNFDSATPRLTIDPASEGTLRCNYPVVYSTDIVNNTLTFAWQDFVSTRTNASFRGHLLIEEGDAFSCNASLSVPNKDGLTAGFAGLITQRGGLFSVKGGTHGLLLGSNDNGAKSLDYVLNLEGGRFEADKLTLWTTQGATFTANVTQGTFAIGALNVRQTNGKFTLNLSENGVFELMGSLATNNPTALVFNGGTLASSLQDVTLGLPAIFAGTDVAPTTIDLAATSTFVLNAGNSGTGVVVVPKGTLAISNVSALGEATVTIGADATYEIRGLAADAAITGTVSFAADALLKITNTAITTGTVKIAGAIADASETPLLLLNGTAYAVTMDKANGTITIGTAVATSTLTWTNTVDEGLWAVGVATPWTPAEAFKHGDSVTFPVKSVDIDGINVKVRGTVAPASMTFATGVSNNDNYTFTSDGASLIDLTAMGADLAVGTGIVYDVPVKTTATASGNQVKLNGDANVYRLIGALDTAGTTASLWHEGTNINVGDVHGKWTLGEEVTLAPHVGETQLLSAGNNDFTGACRVTVTGGGTVRFPGHVGGTNWNGAFSGTFTITDGALLDFAFSRDVGQNQQQLPYFRAGGHPLWMKTAVDGDDVVGFTLSQGGILRFSAAPGIIAGRNHLNEALMVTNHPIVIGTDARVESTTTEKDNVMPYGLIFNGDEATFVATAQTSIATGASLVVAGVGDKGDIADPKTNAIFGDEAYGTLTAGIRATMEGKISTMTGSVGTTVGLVVGEGSTLAFTADVVDQGRFTKTGPGRLSLEAPTWTTPVHLTVAEGVLGGHTTMANAASQVTMRAGTTVEAGLSMGSLVLDKHEGDKIVTMAIDPTGARLLRADAMSFTEAATYAIDVLPGATVAEATLQLPIQIVAWTSAQNADAATFVLSETLKDKGYGLLVRNDGLYLAKQVIYKRMLTGVTSTTKLVDATWYAKEWTRDDASTLVDYAPAAGEAVLVQWVVAGEDPIPSVLNMQVKLDREVEFSSIQVIRENGVEINVDMTYVYDLANETMPEGNEVATFTWVPTLLVNTNSSAEVMASGYDASRYATAIAKATITVYTDSSSPVLNISFGEANEGDTAWLVEGSAPCGAVPFAGAHWNNASTRMNSGVPVSENAMRYTTMVEAEGVEDEDAASISMEYITSMSQTVLSRTTTPNGILTSTYMGGTSTLPAEVVSGVQANWMVALDAVPFKTYDLYLIFAGANDNTAVNYPAVAVKVGDEPWRTFSYINDEATGAWTAPSLATWSGMASPQEGALIHGKHYLRLRVAAEDNASALQIAGLAADATVGLAALQVVECDDGPVMYAVGSSWSGAAAWQREAANGERTNGLWVDATEALPRPAVIENRTVTVDMPAVMPYLQVKGTAGSVVKGTENYLRTSVVDLSCATGAITFEDNVFVVSPQVIMGEDQRISVPEVDVGTMVNDWTWVYPSGVTGSTSTLEKVKAGDLVLKHFYQGAWNIAQGNLVLDVDATHTHMEPIRGDGVFVKRGRGTINQEAEISLIDMAENIPIRVYEGTFTTNKSFATIGDRKAFLVDGPGAWLRQFSQDADYLADNFTFIARNGGLAQNNAYAGNKSAKAPHVRLENGGQYYGDHAGVGYGNYIASLVAIGKGNKIWTADNGYNIGLTIERGKGPVHIYPDASLTLTSNDESDVARFMNGEVIVDEGGTLTANIRVGVSDLDIPLVKKGSGCLELKRAFGGNHNSQNRACKVDVEAGELRFNLEQAYAPDVAYVGTIRVKSGATLSGNATIANEKAPIIIEQGGILSSGVPGVANSKITAHTLTLEDGAIVACDLSKNDCLTVTNMLSVDSNVTVKLTNYGSNLTAPRRLIAWADGATLSGVNNAKAISAEAVALDATLEWVTTGNADEVGLWLTPANSDYKRVEGGLWSDAKWLLPSTYVDEGAFVAGNSARFNITDTVEVVADSNATTSVAALLMDVAEGKTFTLAAKTTVNGEEVVEDDTPLQLSALWKLGGGDAIIKTPLKFTSATAFQVAKGELTLTKPISDGTTNAPQFPMVIEKDATLVLDLGTGADKAVTLPDELSGAGTLAVRSGRVTIGNNKDVKDHDVHYVVEAGAVLSVAQNVEVSTRTAARTVNVGEGATLALNTNRALGSTPNLTMTLADQALVTCAAPTNDYGAHLRGRIELTEGEATIAGDVKVIANTTYDIAGDATLTLTNGAWYVAESEAPSITKTGAGTVVLAGGYNLGSATVVVEEGTMKVANAVTASGDPMMTVKAAATLDLASDIGLSSGSLVVEPNGRLMASAGGMPSVKGRTELSRDAVAVFAADAMGALPMVTFSNLVVNGVVTIDLAVTPDQMKATSTVLMKSSSEIEGGGTFRLGGTNAAAWIEAGWTLRQTKNQVTLVSATADGTYIWGAKDATATWTNGAHWYSADMNEATAWDTTGDLWSAMLANVVTLKDDAGNESEVNVNRTLVWDDAKLFEVMALRSDAMAGHDYTIQAIPAGKTLIVHGEMVLTGDATMTIDCPAMFEANGSLSLLKGTLCLKGGLQQGSTMSRPIAMGQEATIEFASAKNVTIDSTMTLLSEEAEATLGTFRNSGIGTVTFSNDISKVKAFEASKGVFAMAQDDLFTVAPQVMLRDDAAAFSFAGRYTGSFGEDASMHVKVNEGLEQKGIFDWSATGNAAVAKTPRLTSASGMANVSTFRYGSKAGRLTLEADGFFPETTTLQLATSPVETTALLLGKGRAGVEPKVVFGNVTGTAGIVSVEPALNLAAGAWSMRRVLTFKLVNATTTFNGCLLGATAESSTISAGLAIERADSLDATVVPRFTYAGVSTTKLGDFTIAEGTRAEVLGTWAGDIAVAPGGVLTGNGTMGAANATVHVPAGATLSAVVFNANTNADKPTVMPITGTLRLEKGSTLDVLVATDEEGAPVVSCVEAENVQLPNTIDANEAEVKLNVILRLTEDDVYATGKKILGWEALNGFAKVNGTITVYDKAGNEVQGHGYYLRQRSDGLYITRSQARTWLIIR